MKKIFLFLCIFISVATIAQKSQSFLFVNDTAENFIRTVPVNSIVFVADSVQFYLINTTKYSAGQSMYNVITDGNYTVTRSDIDPSITLSTLLFNNGTFQTTAENSIIKGTDSDFSGSGNWALYLGGSLSWDINSTVDDNLYLDFTSGDEALKLDNTLEVGNDYIVKVRLKRISGSKQSLMFGNFQSGQNESGVLINPSLDYREFSFIIRNAISTTLYLGSPTAFNIGGEFAVDYIRLFDAKDLAKEQEAIKYAEIPYDHQVDRFLKSYDDSTKALYKLAIYGNSIMANFYGGEIPVSEDEGVSSRPPRLTVNNIARRTYDLLKDNPPVYKRLDNASWTTSGVWTSTLGGEFLSPTYTTAGQETEWNYSQTPNAYIELIFPTFIDNFVVILHRDDNEFGQDYDDAVTVTLNGGSIAAYGASTINTYRAKLDANDVGNPFYTEHYTGLPSGTKTIRIAKSNTAKTLTVWGAAYWTGNTLMVYNMAHGGRSMEQLYDRHVQADIIENDVDAILFELTGLNELGQSKTLDESSQYFEALLNLDGFGDKDLLVMNTHPWGDNGGGTNYYEDYQNPDLQQLYDRLKLVAYRNNVPHLDIFDLFRKKIASQGGSLIGGEGGLLYTSDGQHLNQDGAEVQFGILKKTAFLSQNIVYNEDRVFIKEDTVGYTDKYIGIGTEDPFNPFQVSNSENDKFITAFTGNIDIGSWNGFQFGYGVEDSFRKHAFAYERTGTAGEGNFHLLINNVNDASNVSITDSVFSVFDDGTFRFKNAGSIGGVLNVEEYIRLHGNADTEIRFLTDRIINNVGGVEVIDMELTTIGFFGTSATLSNAGAFKAATLEVTNLATGYIPYDNGTSLVNSILYEEGGNNIGLATEIPSSYMSGVKGMAIYNATSSGLALANSSTTWLMYASGTDLKFFNGSDRIIMSSSGDLYISGDLNVDNHIINSSTSGITASTTQSQGQQVLITDINEVSVVANVNDVVTMPDAIAGMRIVIMNNGANTLQIFPSSGDNFDGSATDASITLGTDLNIEYVCYDGVVWEVI